MNCYCKTLFFLLLFCFPEIAQAQDFKDFLGTNTRREDPTNRLDAVGFVREYHLWSLDEPVTDACDVSNFFNPTNNTPQYDWENNPAATTERSFVTFYQKLLEDDREMCITLKGSLPIFDNGDCSFDFGKPPVFDADGFVNDPMNCDIVDSPAVTSTEADAYTWYTNYISSLSSFFTGGMYQTYYGNTQSQNLFTGKTFYLENWNEQDKWWCGSPNSFTPQEYAVMSSTNYDGNFNTGNDVALPGFDGGVDDPQDRKFVMGGLLDIEDLEILNEDGSLNRTLNVYDYLEDVQTAMEDYRADGEFVFDVLNFHNYRFSDFGLPRSYGLAPEESDGTANPDLYAKLDALNAHIASLGLSDKDVWLSEFGYDTNPFSDGVALPEYTVTLSKSSLDIIEDVAVSATGSCDVQETNVVELGVTELDLRRTENFQDFYVNNSDGNDNVITANDNSSRILVLRKYWDEIHPEDQKKILDVIYETQARWLVRGFMEVRRADWDKVIQFCIRDEQPFDGRLFKRNSNNEVTCIEEYDPGSYRFKNSGLLEGKESGFSPKTSYYYTRTLKKTLSGTTTIEDLSIAGNTKRVYRFTGGGKTVYAVWLPTEGFNIEEEITLSQFQQYAPGISQNSTLIELEAPYEGGKWSELGENIVVSDKPIFILAKNYDQDYPSSLCESGIDVEYQTCKHVRLSVDNSVGLGQEWDRYQVYYAPFGTVSDPDNPRLDEITLYDDEIDGSLSEIVVTDFQDEEYDFCEYWNIYVRGVIDNEDEYYLSDWCRKRVTSRNCICTVDLNLDMISGDECNDGGFDDAKSLFEYDNLDLCDLDSPANIEELNNEPFWSFNDCNNMQQLRIPFTSAQKIDAVYLYDHTGNNLLTVQGSDGTNSYNLIEYDTRGDGVWKSFANFAYDNGVQPELTEIILTAANNEMRLKKIIVLCHSGKNTPGDEQLVEPNTPTGSESPTVFEEQNKIETVDIIDLPNGDKNFGWDNPLYAESTPLSQDSIRYLVSLSNEYNEETEELINPRQIEINRPKSEEYSELVVSREIEGVDFRKDVRVVIKYECFCKIRTSDDVPVEGYAVSDSDENPQSGKFLEKQNSTEEIYVYPVPAAAELKIEINIEGVKSLDIFDLNGRFLQSAPLFSGKGTSIVNTADFPSGVYLLRAVKDDGSVIVKRFVKTDG